MILLLFACSLFITKDCSSKFGSTLLLLCLLRNLLEQSLLKIQQTTIAVTKIQLSLQSGNSSHEFEPTLIILVLI